MTARTAPADLLISESQFQDAVIQLAQLRGWRLCHFRAGRSSRGWRTPIIGNPGWPDLAMVKDTRFLVAELKAERGRLTEDQQQWLHALTAAGVEVHVWKPSSWPEIVATLRRSAS